MLKEVKWLNYLQYCPSLVLHPKHAAQLQSEQLREKLQKFIHTFCSWMQFSCIVYFFLFLLISIQKQTKRKIFRHRDLTSLFSDNVQWVWHKNERYWIMVWGIGKFYGALCRVIHFVLGVGGEWSQLWWHI